MKKCPDCKKYTLENTCPVCKVDTKTPHPAKFSPIKEMKYKKYKKQSFKLEKIISD